MGMRHTEVRTGTEHRFMLRQPLSSTTSGEKLCICRILRRERIVAHIAQRGVDRPAAAERQETAPKQKDAHRIVATVE